ncbi:hypothetical protein TNCV_2252741 [Trichonephila clavipes]|nr:hypothetical protein TNCV_2252741 [Trichonephila clavipes]
MPDRTAGRCASRHVRWSLRLNRFITEDDTSSLSHSQVARGVDTAMMWGQCDVVGAEVATLLIARSSRYLCSWRRPDPPRRYTLPSVVPTPKSYRSEGGGRYVYSTNLLL